MNVNKNLVEEKLSNHSNNSQDINSLEDELEWELIQIKPKIGRP